MRNKHPHYRYIRHHPVSAQANHCTKLASGLRLHPWRGGNTIFAHPECGGGSERTVRFCEWKEGRKGCISMRNKHPHYRYIRHHPVSAQANHCTKLASGLRLHPWQGGNTIFAHPECGGGSERTVRFCEWKEGRKEGVQFDAKQTPPLSLHSASPRLRTGESLQ
jgi:hypothetical protein